MGSYTKSMGKLPQMGLIDDDLEDLLKVDIENTNFNKFTYTEIGSENPNVTFLSDRKTKAFNIEDNLKNQQVSNTPNQQQTSDQIESILNNAPVNIIKPFKNFKIQLTLPHKQEPISPTKNIFGSVTKPHNKPYDTYENYGGTNSPTSNVDAQTPIQSQSKSKFMLTTNNKFGSNNSMYCTKKFSMSCTSLNNLEEPPKNQNQDTSIDNSKHANPKKTTGSISPVKINFSEKSKNQM